MGTYDWRVGIWRGNGTASPVGYGGTPFSPGAVGAPSTASKLKRIGLGVTYHVAGTAPSITITPDWPWTQTGAVGAAVQAAGTTATPNVESLFGNGMKVSEVLTQRPWSFGWSTSQAAVSLQTNGLVWSKGEDDSPGGGGLQVRPTISMDDGSGLIGLFGGGFRWEYYVHCRVLWFTP